MSPSISAAASVCIEARNVALQEEPKDGNISELCLRIAQTIQTSEWDECDVKVLEEIEREMVDARALIEAGKSKRSSGWFKGLLKGGERSIKGLSLAFSSQIISHTEASQCVFCWQFQMKLNTQSWFFLFILLIFVFDISIQPLHSGS
jgi:hypothetical protein